MTKYGVYIGQNNPSYFGEKGFISFVGSGDPEAHASYIVETDQTLNVYDNVIVDTSGILYFGTVCSIEPKRAINSKAVFVDTFSLEEFQAAKAKKEQEKLLRTELDQMTKVQAEIDKYASYAESNPAIADKLNQLRSLMGLTTTKTTKGT